MKFLKPLLASVVFVSFLSASYAQQINNLINNGPSDATKLARAYFMPAFKGFGFGMNSAWYNSAKAKNLGKFDIKIQGTAALVPAQDQTFDISKLGLSNAASAKGNPVSPTFLSDNNNAASVSLKDDNNNEVASIDLPKGSGIKFAPSSQLQVTVGIIKNTDVSVRYTPQIGKETGKFGTLQVLGFGLKHEITKYLFPGKLDKIIPIDLALAFGYNQLTYNYKLPIADQQDDQNTGRDLGQKVDVKLSGFTVDAILSKKLSVFTPFVSVGYNSSQTQLKVLGDFIVNTGINNGLPPTPRYTTFTDPVNIKQNDISGLRANIGFSLHLAFFRLYGSYSIGQYQAVSGGIGFGIGK
ncbi:hypothetical protein I5M32_13755 [Pedobacter sp. SD-b]|uniref:Outer membrane protein beta-barrel domain-containing protein n=1 Tax=Pedobacter segetis TaxID=2793069 RepID=A0ABS1BMA9_9SPHI|nr:DUF6588 family protein [Pedobacter segetis]MBK0384029.1 hypothetical protein [Pedobacter segetis]